MWSHVGNTEIIIGVCAVVVAVLWMRTRHWWFAVIPAIGISLRATIFVTVSPVVGRSRPDVPHLDPAPPTSSYPSDHVGASVALHTSLAMMATTIERTWLRRTVIGECSVIPLLVAYARLYRACIISATSSWAPSTAWSAPVWPLPLPDPQPGQKYRYRGCWPARHCNSDWPGRVNTHAGRT